MQICVCVCVCVGNMETNIVKTELTKLSKSCIQCSTLLTSEADQGLREIEGVLRPVEALASVCN